MDGSRNTADFNQDAARLAVADILSTMANTVEPMTPTTLAILDGLTGVPTRTTPTLTPTTLRNIEQTFMDLAAVASNQIPHHHEAGFVPPLVPLTVPAYSAPSAAHQASGASYTMADSSKSWQNTGNSNDSTGSSGTFRTSVRRLSEGSDSNSSNSMHSSSVSGAGTSRKGGGRRKEDRDKELELPVEEAEKRRVRRERNKMAAARCRKRRLDHTMALEEETSALEDKKLSLQNEIRQLKKEKEELEFLLDSHAAQCKVRAAKMPSAMNLKQEPESQRNNCKCPGGDKGPEFTKPAPRPRPTSLPVASPFTPQINKPLGRPPEIAGIAITTPSNGILGLNLESLMEGGTGLTPVVPGQSPSCATQQRGSTTLPVDLSSPESTTRKLVSL